MSERPASMPFSSAVKAVPTVPPLAVMNAALQLDAKVMSKV